MRCFRQIYMTAIIFIILLILSLQVSAENIFEKEVEKEASAVKFLREVQKGRYDIVTTQELKSWIDSGKEMVLIDAMPYGHYKKKHIPGALQFLFPIPEMSSWDTSETDGKSKTDYIKLLGPDMEKAIVIYCGFVKCTRSHNGAVWARQLGYKNVYRHPGGIYAWEGAKYDLESGSRSNN